MYTVAIDGWVKRDMAKLTLALVHSWIYNHCLACLTYHSMFNILPTIKPSKNKYNFHSLLGFVGAFIGNPADMVNVR